MNDKLRDRLKEIGKSKQKTVSYERPNPFEQKPSKMKKTLRALLRTISGKNKTGEAIHGVLDLVPIPNQVIAKAAGYFVSGDTQEAKDELRKLVSFRNIVAFVGSIAFITGLIEIDDLRRLIELF